MNKNSKLCCFMSEHKNWREKLEELYNFYIEEEELYAILYYDDELGDFSSPLVREARGIIIDTETLEVVCWPFSKFGDFDESYADKIDWKTARVQEKIDGSIIKLWYDTRNGDWRFSTKGMIDAGDAYVDDELEVRYTDVIHKADNYKDILFGMLDPNLTYIFELVSPESQVIIRYESAHLYHIGTRNNKTGMELCADIGVEKPKEYTLRTLEDCIRAAQALNWSSDGKVHGVQKEGFVVVDSHWNRNKVKSMEYCMLRHLVACTDSAKERLVDLLRKGMVDVDDLCQSFPKLAPYFKYYDYKVTELAFQADVFADLSRRVYRWLGCDRKKTAMKIQKQRLAPVGSLALDSELAGKEILKRQPIREYSKYIPDYKPEEISIVLYDVGEYEEGEG